MRQKDQQEEEVRFTAENRPEIPAADEPETSSYEPEAAAVCFAEKIEELAACLPAGEDGSAEAAGQLLKLRNLLEEALRAEAVRKTTETELSLIRVCKDALPCLRACMSFQDPYVISKTGSAAASACALVSGAELRVFLLSGGPGLKKRERSSNTEAYLTGRKLRNELNALLEECIEKLTIG